MGQDCSKVFQQEVQENRFHLKSRSTGNHLSWEALACPVLSAPKQRLDGHRLGMLFDGPARVGLDGLQDPFNSRLGDFPCAKRGGAGKEVYKGTLILPLGDFLSFEGVAPPTR